LIRQQLAEGKTKDEIKQYFALHYGDRVLSEPPRQGLNLLVYILPPVFFLAGVYLVVRVLRSTRKSAAPTPTVASVLPPSDDPYVQRLEEELKKRNYGK
jgi:cytochrome c-type biogenesis protein CcmH